MGSLKIKVAKVNSHRRLDLYLVEALRRRYSRSAIQNLIAAGNVLVNGRSPKAHQRVKADDEISINTSKAPSASLELPLPEDIPVEVVYEDEDLLVVNKPAGMVVHPHFSSGRMMNLSGTLVNALLFHCGDKLSDVGGPFRPGIVHRLDKQVSGLLLVAKTNACHYNLIRQFESRKINKLYTALVKGEVPFEEGKIDLPLGRNSHHRQRQTVRFIGKSRKAETFYRVVKRLEDFTMLELEPVTGRTHQLRVHLKHMGCPILGDAKYGSKDKMDRLALHARKIGFRHPRTGQYLEFSSELPKEIKEKVAHSNSRQP